MYISTNQFEEIKKKYKNVNRSKEIENLMNIIGAGLFDYEPPYGLEKGTCERAISTGIAAFYKCNSKNSVNFGKWCCTPAYNATVANNNGIASEIVTSGTDYAEKLKVGTECVLIFNNNTKSADETKDSYSKLINEVDKTILTIVKWCRMTPIPKAYDDVEIAKMTKIMQNIMDGELINVISDKKSRLFDNNSGRQNNDLLQLTDVSAAEKLHFLSEFREEIIKRIATLYGIPFRTSAKNAQDLKDSLHSFDIFSLYIPFDRFYWRKKGFEECERFMAERGEEHKFNFKWSELMLHQITDIFTHAEKNNETKESVSRETNSDFGELFEQDS